MEKRAEEDVGRRQENSFFSADVAARVEFSTPQQPVMALCAESSTVSA